MVSENNFSPTKFEITASFSFKIKPNFCQPRTILIHRDRKNIFEHIGGKIQGDQYRINRY